MSLYILTTGPHEEIHRNQDGDERWCFVCRKRRVFEFVIKSPVWDQSLPVDEWPTDAWYGPHHQIECSHCHTVDGDLFPGRWRAWGDE